MTQKPKTIRTIRVVTSICQSSLKSDRLNRCPVVVVAGHCCYFILHSHLLSHLIQWNAFIWIELLFFWFGSFLVLHHSFRKGKKRNLLGVPHHFHNSTVNEIFFFVCYVHILIKWMFHWGTIWTFVRRFVQVSPIFEPLH